MDPCATYVSGPTKAVSGMLPAMSFTNHLNVHLEFLMG